MFIVPRENNVIYKDRWVVITGVRDLPVGSDPRVVAKMEEITVARPLGIVFGGARGVDTLALRTAWLVRHRPHDGVPHLLVIVPGTVQQQPLVSRGVIAKAADEIIELGLPLDRPISFHVRNGRMLREAILRDPNESPVCVAFSDGLDGGTGHTIRAAAGLGVETEHIHLERPDEVASP